MSNKVFIRAKLFVKYDGTLRHLTTILESYYELPNFKFETEEDYPHRMQALSRLFTLTFHIVELNNCKYRDVDYEIQVYGMQPNFNHPFSDDFDDELSHFFAKKLASYSPNIPNNEKIEKELYFEIQTLVENPQNPNEAVLYTFSRESRMGKETTIKI